MLFKKLIINNDDYNFKENIMRNEKYFLPIENSENHYERWNMGKENFLYEIKARNIPTDHCSSSFIDDLYEYSNMLASLYSLPSNHYQRFRKEFLSCLTVDIGCLILNHNYLGILLAMDIEYFNVDDKECNFAYHRMVSSLIYGKRHLLTDSQKLHFGDSVEAIGIYTW